ncbi:MAG: aminotransferase class III-fold pyridoxal phosphate-dependent enzyme, partial [Myxococcales bacterium]|nr:aminotransferase class III-fold pyridoxal phosphate-dependent enzyme [Myxococcales bacterium]
LRFGAQDDASAFAGPMASVAAREQFERALERARAGGATELARGVAPDGHAFAPPTLFALPDGVHHIDGYTNHELFGPNLHIEPVDSDEDAIAVLNASPVALAISVFTGDEARYARFVSATDTAIVNLNRSTNQASPRLPFGGTGTAGNFRPAGAHAPRNLAVPVATQRKVRGALVPDPKLAATLPTPDLDALEAQHGMEECKEAGRSPVEQRRPMSPRLPEGGRIAQSEQWLERLYGEGRMPMEKKPGVFDHLRSHGPWMVSVDDAPLSVLDAMSQTATLPAGFAHDEVVRCYIEGAFGDTLLHADDTTVGEHPAAVAYANFLRSRLRGLPHVSFVSSGAEANDKAYALAMAHRRSDKQRRLLAFEGSFHGRTLLPLQASHNPAKRAPFEFKGYEVEYASYAAWWTPDVPEPEDPENFVARVASGELGAVLEENLNGGDRLFVEELQSLVEVDRHLGTGDFFAAVIEPIQSEGGDRYATARFHRGLRALTRRHGVPLIYDEVQSGFGLGGTFAWHARFKLEKADGTPDTPDMVLFAKRAQVGVVMSAFEDPEPTYAHTASLVRGLIHAQSVADDQAEARGIEREVRERLEVVAKRYPMLVSRPRVTGYAVAFDLPSTDHLNRFLAQRFWRGVVVFAAGTRTVRYRLSRTFGTQEIETLFDAMDRSLAWLHANPGHTPPAWLDVAQFKVELDEGRDDVRVRRIRKDEADAVLEAVLELEARVYEPARRDDPAWLRMAFEEDGIAVVAEANVDGGWKLIGSALAAPLERAEAVEGPDRDPMLGKENTAYSLAITMDPEWRGIGLGRTLKREELRAARELRRADGAPRYRFLTGRNRMDQTAAMARINRSFGAHEVVVLDNQYGEASARASYYRIPLAAYAPVSRDGVHTKPPEGVDV